MATFAERLKSARIKAGFSMRGLADQLGNRISFQAISHYEKGLYEPDEEKVALFCQVLNVRPDYFEREVDVQLQSISFRKLESTPEKSKAAFIEEVKDHVERYLELEEIVGNYKKPEESDLEKISATNLEEAEVAAMKLRERWNIGSDPIAQIVNLIEDKGILFFEIPAVLSVDGVSTIIESPVKKCIIVLNKSKNVLVERKRFTIAHELGHLILELPVDMEEKKKEKMCDRFAAAFLLPGPTLKNEIGEKCSRVLLPELNDIKKEYGISVWAILYRMHDLDIITPSYFKFWMNYLVQIGYRTNEPSFYNVPATSRRFEQMILRAYAEEWISLSKAASLCNMKTENFRKEILEKV